jgi:hypothetical protein
MSAVDQAVKEGAKTSTRTRPGVTHDLILQAKMAHAALNDTGLNSGGKLLLLALVARTSTGADRGRNRRGYVMGSCVTVRRLAADTATDEGSVAELLDWLQDLGYIEMEVVGGVIASIRMVDFFAEDVK